MRQQTSEAEYLRKFWDRMSEVGDESIPRNRTTQEPCATSARTRVLCCDLKQQKPLQLWEIESIAHRQNQEDFTVIIIENINLDWIGALGTSLDVDPAFFCKHAMREKVLRTSLWESVFGQSREGHAKYMQSSLQPPAEDDQCNMRTGSDSLTKVSWHVDGVFEFGQSGHGLSQTRPLYQNPNFVQRRFELDAQYGLQASTRISYCQIQENLYLFVVDAPMELSTYTRPNYSTSVTRLNLPVSRNRGGLLLPPLLGLPQHSLYESLQQFFSHAWHLKVLTHQGLSAETVLYLLVASTWNANLRYLDRDIKRVAFEDIRRPSISINDQLHDFRQSLVTVRSEVAKARKWIPQLVAIELENMRDSIYAGSYVGFPDTAFDEILADAEVAQRFLIDTFQLLMSSISVMDSETRIKQAHSGQKLTQLAFIYVPLSFVSSIFGMNIKEINGSRTPAWICIVVLVITMLCTAALFSAYNMWEKYIQDKKSFLRHKEQVPN